ITFATDIKKPLSLGCQRGMLRKVMRPFDRAHHIRRESGISMPQEFIGKNQNPSAVIPTKVGI
ncbi:hypothetical protein, partial [Neisseria meningitidis]|uniref:hypothetical protein n=1 Tax=Neisseria meningitidis TaxID=487 RepID=UPI003F68849E